VDAKKQVRRYEEEAGPETETDRAHRVEAVPENQVLRRLQLQEAAEVLFLHCDGDFQIN
jgi:hypothetical protein